MPPRREDRMNRDYVRCKCWLRLWTEPKLGKGQMQRLGGTGAGDGEGQSCFGVFCEKIGSERCEGGELR